MSESQKPERDIKAHKQSEKYTYKEKQERPKEKKGEWLIQIKIKDEKEVFDQKTPKPNHMEWNNDADTGKSVDNYGSIVGNWKLWKIKDSKAKS